MLFAQQFSRKCVRNRVLLVMGQVVLCSSMMSTTGRVCGQQKPSTETQSGQIAERATGESSLEFDQSEHEDQGNTQKSKPERRGAIVVAPIPISSPAIGTGGVVLGGYIFPLRKSDTVSLPSVVGGAVLATDNGSRGIALVGDFYFKQNTYHTTTAYFHGNINYDFYGVGTLAGNAGLKLPLKQTGQAFLGDVLYRVFGQFFVGPRALTGNSLITLLAAPQILKFAPRRPAPCSPLAWSGQPADNGTVQNHHVNLFGKKTECHSEIPG